MIRCAIQLLITLVTLLIASTVVRAELLVSSFSSNRVLHYNESTGSFLLTLPHAADAQFFRLILPKNA